MYQAIRDIISKIKTNKKERIYCTKGQILIPLTTSRPLIVADKNEIFPVSDEDVKKIDMNTSKLLTAIKDVSENPSITDKTFPYDFVTGITENKEWEKDFLEQLKKSNINQSIKTNILKKYESTNL